MTGSPGARAALRRRIENDFTYHPPTSPEQTLKYTALRTAYSKLAGLLIDTVPAPSRELATALTHLESSVMWANAGIARNESRGDVDDDPLDG